MVFSVKIKNRHFLKTGEIKKFQATVEPLFMDLGRIFDKNSKVESGILEDGTIVYFINGNLAFFKIGEGFVPFLRLLLNKLIQLPKIVIDMGAVPYITKGADVMFPGIVATDENIKENDYVVIVDEKHSKPLAIGVAVVDSEQISRIKKGKAIKNLHYVGDRMWDFGKNIGSK